MWPLAARAQKNNVRRVGVLMNAAADEKDRQAFLGEFIDGLRDLGWIEGKSVHIDVRWNAGNADLARTYAAQLIGLTPDVLFVSSTTNLRMAQQATNTIPIVFIQTTDPVVQGLVPNLTRPGGNTTGFYSTEFSIASKWVELLKQVSPKLERIAVIFNPATSPQSKFYIPAVETGGRTFGVQVVAKPVRSSTDIEAATENFGQQSNGGLIMFTDTYARLHDKLIAELALRYRLASISAYPEFVREGGLLSYSGNADIKAQYRHAASYVDRILKGAKAGDLPVQGATKFGLVINLKTAKALDLQVPPKLLFTADEVVE